MGRLAVGGVHGLARGDMSDTTTLAELCNRVRHDPYTLCYWIREACMTHSVWNSTGDSIIHIASKPTIIVGADPYCVPEANAHYPGCEHENADPAGPNWI